YSVMVLDLMVPEINGFEIIEYVKANKIDVPIAVVSAVSQQALTRLDLDIVKLVITKPFDVDEVTKAILGICRDRRGAAGRAGRMPALLDRHGPRLLIVADPLEHLLQRVLQKGTHALIEG